MYKMCCQVPTNLSLGTAALSLSSARSSILFWSSFLLESLRRKCNMSLIDRSLANGLQRRTLHTKNTDRWLQSLPSPNPQRCYAGYIFHLRWSGKFRKFLIGCLNFPCLVEHARISRVEHARIPRVEHARQPIRRDVILNLCYIEDNGR